VIPSTPTARTAIIRTLVVFTPLLAIALAILIALIVNGASDGFSGGVIAGLVVMGFVGLLVGYQVVQAVWDLFGAPVERDGRVERAWNRSEFFLFRNSYIFVNGDVFRLCPEQDIEVSLGDLVRIRHYPHTATVEAIEVLERAPTRERAGG
jgi:xanthosine utilization system XapX-like protein